MQNIHLSLWGPSEGLSVRLDNEVDINLKASTKFILHSIFFNWY